MQNAITIMQGEPAEKSASQPVEKLLRIRKAKWSRVIEFSAVVLPALILVLLGGTFNKFVGHAISANPALNFTILGVLFFGVLIIGNCARDLLRQREAATEWFDSVDQPETREKWRRTFGFSLTGEGLHRIFGAKSYQDAESLLEAVQVESNAIALGLEHRMSLAGYLVGGMVALGLLGTFIGLLETLVSISSLITGVVTGLSGNGAVEAAISTMVSELRGPLNSMATAFSASMFGVTGSVVLGLMLVLLRRRNHAFAEQLRSDVQDHAAEVIQKLGLAHENRVTVGFLRQHLGLVSESLARQSGHFEVVAAETQRTDARVGQALAGLERVVEVYSGLASRFVALEGMAAEMAAMNKTSMESLTCAKALNAQVGMLLEAAETSHANERRLSELTEEQRLALADAAKDVGDRIDAGVKSLGQWVAAACAAVQTDVRSVIPALEGISDSNIDLRSALAVIEQVLVQAVDESGKRDEREVQALAKLASAMQAVRDTVGSLSERQSGDLAQSMVRMERHLVDLKGVATSEEALLRSVAQRASESASMLGRQTSVIEGIRMSLERKAPARSSKADEPTDDEEGQNWR